MSNDTQIKLAGEHGAAVTQQVQYGIRFPDGTTTWNVIPQTGLDITALAVPEDRRHHEHLKTWLRVTKDRANTAQVDVEAYREQHTFIQRTVILSVTATEEV